MTKFGPGATVAVITFIARNAKNAIPTRALQGYAKGETLTAVVIKCAIGDKWLARIINNDGLDVDGIVNRSWEYKTARAKALLLASEI